MKTNITAKAYKADCCDEAKNRSYRRKTSHAASNTMRTSIEKPNPNRDPEDSYKRQPRIPLASQQNLERPRLVAHQAYGCEEPPKLNDWPEHPIFPSNGSHGAFVLGAVYEEPGCAFDVLASNRQLDLWRLLHVLYPLAIYVRCPDVEPVSVQNKPDRDFVWFPGLTTIVSQTRGLFPSDPPQSRKFSRFHHLSLATFNMTQLVSCDAMGSIVAIETALWHAYIPLKPTPDLASRR